MTLFPRLQQFPKLRVYHSELQIILLHSRGEIIPELNGLSLEQKKNIIRVSVRLGYIWREELAALLNNAEPYTPPIFLQDGITRKNFGHVRASMMC
ncbi:MAG: hypothetical protein WC222_08375 [Parachlamydiales bacterium]